MVFEIMVCEYNFNQLLENGFFMVWLKFLRMQWNFEFFHGMMVWIHVMKHICQQAQWNTYMNSRYAIIVQMHYMECIDFIILFHIWICLNVFFHISPICRAFYELIGINSWYGIGLWIISLWWFSSMNNILDLKH